MRKRIIFLSMIILLICPTFFIGTTIKGAVDNQPNTAISTNVINLGAPAIDWELEEIKSDTNMTFSSFTGKVAMIDFFATWCGPCIDTFPILGDIKDHYSTEPNFVLMSIKVDPEYDDNETELEKFAEQHEMDWYIFRDLVNMDIYYNIEFIPTLIIFNQYQYVYFTEIGTPESADPFIEVIDELLNMNDNSPPTIENFFVDKDTISVLENGFTVSADLSDKALRHVAYTFSMGDYNETKDFWAPDNGTFVYKFNIDPKAIWNATEEDVNLTTIDILVEDFVGKNSTDQISLNLITLQDNNPPEFNMIDLVVESAQNSAKFEIVANVTDDLLVASVQAEIWIDGELKASKEMTPQSANIFETVFYSIQVSKGESATVKIIAEDVSGKKTVEEFIVTPNTDALTVFTIPILISAFLVVNIILISLKKLKKVK